MVEIVKLAKKTNKDPDRVLAQVGERMKKQSGLEVSGDWYFILPVMATVEFDNSIIVGDPNQLNPHRLQLKISGCLLLKMPHNPRAAPYLSICCDQMVVPPLRARPWSAVSRPRHRHRLRCCQIHLSLSF